MKYFRHWTTIEQHCCRCFLDKKRTTDNTRLRFGRELKISREADFLGQRSGLGSVFLSLCFSCCRFVWPAGKREVCWLWMRCGRTAWLGINVSVARNLGLTLTEVLIGLHRSVRTYPNMLTWLTLVNPYTVSVVGRHWRVLQLGEDFWWISATSGQLFFI